MLSLGRNLFFSIKRNQIRDQNALWLTSFFRHMAYSLVSLMSVVFLFEFGRTTLHLGIIGGLVLVILSRIIFRSSVILVIMPIGNYFIREIGYKHTIIFSLLGSIFTFICLALAESTQNVWFLWLYAVSNALVTCTYWVTWATLLANDSKEESMGSAFALMDAISKLSQVLAPFVGAIVVVTLGYQWLFFVTIVLLIMAAIPALLLNHHIQLDTVSWREFLNWSKEKVFLQAGLAIGGDIIYHDFYMVMWPLYIFIVLGSIKDLGWFGTIISLATVIFTILISKIFDKRKSKSIQYLGVIGGAVLWFLRLIPRTLPGFIFIETVDRFFASITRLYFFGNMLRRAKGPETFSFMVYWELWNSLWLVGAYLVLLVVIFMFDVAGMWIMMVALAAIGMLLTVLMKPSRRLL